MTEILDTMARAYLECALWLSPGECDESGELVAGEFLDADYDFSDLDRETEARARRDCARFLELHGLPQYGDRSRLDCAEKCGHDFWLTRNHHGAGFWDRDDLPEGDGDRLTAAAHAFGECDLVVGEDGLLHFFGGVLV